MGTGLIRVGFPEEAAFLLGSEDMKKEERAGVCQTGPWKGCFRQREERGRECGSEFRAFYWKGLPWHQQAFLLVEVTRGSEGRFC